MPLDACSRIWGMSPWNRTDDALKKGVLVCFESSTIRRDIVKAGGQRLVDEDPLAGLEDRGHLREVRPPIDAREQDDVDLGEEGIDAVDELDAMLLLDGRRELVDTVALNGRSGLPPLNAATTLILPFRVRAEDVRELRDV